VIGVDMDSKMKCRKNPDIVSRRIANEVILVPVRNKVGDLQSIYTLNEVGARIWELIDRKDSLKEIKDVLVEEFEVTPEAAEKDISEFLKKLESIGAIIIE